MIRELSLGQRLKNGSRTCLKCVQIENTILATIVALDGSGDKARKERMRPIGTRLELWMGLRSYEIGVIIKFHKFNKATVG
jgi:hypothetical protein